MIVGRKDSPSKLSSRAIIALVFLLGFLGASRNIMAMRRLSMSFDEDESSYGSDGAPSLKAKKTTVAYAVTITKFELDGYKDSHAKHLDRAAVLHQSIKLAMQKSAKYDYHIYAFVHPEASDAKPFLERLGYRVQIRDTPFNMTAIDNFELVDSQRIGCCGEKEYLKLYSYLLLDYPVVVHLDLDTIVLRPMDDVFDFMSMTQPSATTKLSSQEAKSFARRYGMWMNKTLDRSSTHWSPEILETPEQINFMFTRDYNMVDPPLLKPFQIGVQGGFLIVRPNQRDFNRMVHIIKSGGEFKEARWGYETLKGGGYGGYYGAATIQGLASYYYDHHEKAKRSLELNRCKYNTMVDKHLFFNEQEEYNRTFCTTTEETCEDCRKTKLEEIFTSHFTECGKPEFCEDQSLDTLCGQLLHEWHKIRLSLEMEWMNRFSSLSNSPYVPKLMGSKPNTLQHKTMGHCKGHFQYIPMVFPFPTSPSDFETGVLI